MTRFARAESSKASNKRYPDEPTPWHVMKQQLEEALAREQQKDDQVKTKSAKQLLDEKDDLYYADSLGKVKTKWEEFDVPKNKVDAVKNGKVEKKPKDKKKKVKKAVEQAVVEENVTPVDSADVKSKKKENGVAEQSNGDAQSKVKQKKKKKNKKAENLSNSDSNQFKDKKRKNEEDGALNGEASDSNKKQKVKAESESENKILSKRQKRNQKKQNQKKEQPEGEGNSTGIFNAKGNDWSTSVKFGETGKNEDDDKSNKKTNVKAPFKKREWLDDHDWKNFRRFGNNVPKKFQKKVAKVRDDGEHTPRKPTAEPSTKMTINGMDVEIVKYDGYPVKKEDAERLKELKKQMILKGIPKPNIDAAMKLERRKCEKALARIRKQVCFHCRRAGHNLSDCPELGKEEVATGICFKCGSTEHTHFECKVNKSDNYGHAKCFICKEQGHIAKQCPDNPKGIYPDGGSCGICGDVTHLKKDCPVTSDKREENNSKLKLDTIKDDNLESLDTETVKSKPEIKPTKKIVKF